MCQLLESIKIVDGQPCHLKDHEDRINNSRRVLFGIPEPLVLSNQLLNTQIDGVVKCRMIYSERIYSIEFQPYTPRLIKALRLIENNRIDYAHKYANRSMFNNLPPHPADEDFLIVKNGHITDTTFSNIAFFDGKQWVTPSSYLLNGTQRQRLLREGRIISREINVNDLASFVHARLINAMLEFDSTPTIEMAAIQFLNK